MIKDTPTSTVRGLAIGPVEVYGAAAKAQRILLSPFSQKECVYYKFTIEEYRSNGKNSHWVVTKRGIENTPFFIKDKTGTVLVDPVGANIDIPLDNEFNSSTFKDIPKEVKKYCKNNGVRYEAFFGRRRMRFREYFLAPGDKVYVLGTADKNPYVKEGTAQVGYENIMIQKGGNNSFFYISDKSEEEILSTFTWKVIGGLWGGGVMIIFSVFILFLLFNIL